MVRGRLLNALLLQYGLNLRTRTGQCLNLHSSYLCLSQLMYKHKSDLLPLQSLPCKPVEVGQRKMRQIPGDLLHELVLQMQLQ